MDISNNDKSKYSLNDFTINRDDDFEVILENKNIILNYSENVFDDIQLTIEKRKELQPNGKLWIIGYRYSGFDEKQSYLKAIKQLHSKLLQLNNIYIYYNESIPIKIDEGIANEVSTLLIGIELNTENDELEGLIEKGDFFNITYSNAINELFKKVFHAVLKEYINNEPGVNISKVKNFSAKILSWAKQYISVIFKNKIIDNNPKIIYYGSIKKHESYFLIMMSMMGSDVLIFEPSGQSELRKIDKNQKYFFNYEGKFKENIRENPFEKINVEASKVESKGNEINTKNLLNSNFMLAVNLKRSIDIFKDIKLNINDRGGYTIGNGLIIPVYFYRYIGQEASEFTEVEYNNEIYLLDKELENSNCNYLKFIEQIEPPQSHESELIVNVLDNILKKVMTIDKEVIFNEIKNNKLLPQLLNKSVSNTMEYALREVFGMYLKNENTNLTKTKNFLAKLIVWINRYSKILFKNIKKEGFFNFNPKILYFGEIKYTEIYMLIFFSMVGCDVLFINSDYKADDIFVCIDGEEQYTKLQKNSNNVERGAFPKEEKVARKSTVAYEASNEVEQLLFTPDSGLYKPWQFERFNTLPITLKTTLEEVFILWEEEARIRANFKIANNTVYVPNIFAKISGTYEDIGKYWSCIDKLKKAQNSYLISKVPFSKVNFTREEVFSLAYVINKDGTVDKEKLIQSNFYKFSYMKDCIQNFIIQKINELIKSDYFCNEIDNKFTLRIIFTVLNLQEEILRLIQNFDFPHAIPKLIVYVNDRSEFSEEDIITILLLNLMGMDIIILVPTGYNNIENHIKRNVFDTHELPSYKLDLQLNETQNKKELKSIFSRIFKQH